jgi:hypothetical protein
MRIATEIKAAQDVPRDARDDLIALITGIDDPRLKKALIRVLAACRRDRMKRISDQSTDRNRRTLAGAHLPRWRVDQYKALAEQAHMSLHAWVLTALEAQAFRQGAGTMIRPQGDPEIRRSEDPQFECDREECDTCPHSMEDDRCRIQEALARLDAE